MHHTARLQSLDTKPQSDDESIHLYSNEEKTASMQLQPNPLLLLQNEHIYVPLCKSCDGSTGSIRDLSGASQ